MRLSAVLLTALFFSGSLPVTVRAQNMPSHYTRILESDVPAIVRNDFNKHVLVRGDSVYQTCSRLNPGSEEIDQRRDGGWYIARIPIDRTDRELNGITHLDMYAYAGKFVRKWDYPSPIPQGNPVKQWTDWENSKAPDSLVQVLKVQRGVATLPPTFGSWERCTKPSSIPLTQVKSSNTSFGIAMFFVFLGITLGPMLLLTGILCQRRPSAVKRPSYDILDFWLLKNLWLYLLTRNYSDEEFKIFVQRMGTTFITIGICLMGLGLIFLTKL